MGNYLIFDDVNSSNFDIYISGEGLFNAPSRDVESVSIPGRDGDLQIDHGRFNNIQVTYTAFNFENGLVNFRTKLANLRNALASKKGYQRLTDTFHPDEYRLGVFKEGLEVDPVMYNYAANMELVFDCKPQRFLVSGETSTDIADGGSITNPTRFDAKPLIFVTGSGSFTVNGVTVQVPDGVYLDCDIMEAYRISGGAIISANNEVTLTDFPVLVPGANTFALTGITKLTITPRWWIL